jgi:DNA topoisomerase-2
VEKVADTEGKYLIKGRYEKTGKPDQIRITELPVGTWTLAYKTFLEGLCDSSALDKDGKKIAPLLKDAVSHSTDTLVDFTVDLLPGKLAEWESAIASPGINQLEKTLKLTTTVSTTNMHLFDDKRQLRKYATVEEIIEGYLPVRLELYQTRKTALLKDGEHRLKVLRNKARFIQGVLDEVVDLRKKSNATVVELLQGRGYDLIGGTGATEGSEASYHYLTKMPMDSVSLENHAHLMKELAKTTEEMAELAAKTTKQMWLEELDDFEKAYDKRYVKELKPVSTKKEKKV